MLYLYWFTEHVYNLSMYLYSTCIHISITWSIINAFIDINVHPWTKITHPDIIFIYLLSGFILTFSIGEAFIYLVH